MADKSVCKIDGCNKPVIARGWCNTHYKRWQQHGDPNAYPQKWGRAAAFIENVVFKNEDDACLIWPFFMVGGGYAATRVEGRPKRVSRIICERIYGEPAPDSEAAHSCGNRACVNPKHLRWATPKENAADKIIHGTTTHGVRNGMAKLSEREILEIRKLSPMLSLSQIGKRYGISKSQAGNIVRRDSWKVLHERNTDR